MARLEIRGGQPVLLAEEPREQTFLRYSEQRDGEVVLDDALYPVRGCEVGLPVGISQAGAERLVQALGRAAEAHNVALQRRGELKLT